MACQKRLIQFSLLALLASPAVASEASDAARRLLDLSPERVAAFNKALHDFTGGFDDPAAADFYFRARYSEETAPPSPSCLRPTPDAIDDIRVPRGQDTSFVQDFMLLGREHDYEVAARRWVERTFKGSDAAALAADRAGRWQPRADWNDGPVVGFRRGVISATAGWSGDWRIRLSRPMKGHPGWTWRTWYGQRDGDDVAGFTIGRSLYASTRER